MCVCVLGVYLFEKKHIIVLQQSLLLRVNSPLILNNLYQFVYTGVYCTGKLMTNLLSLTPYLSSLSPPPSLSFLTPSLSLLSHSLPISPLSPPPSLSSLTPSLSLLLPLLSLSPPPSPPLSSSLPLLSLSPLPLSSSLPLLSLSPLPLSSSRSNPTLAVPTRTVTG